MTIWTPTRTFAHIGDDIHNTYDGRTRAPTTQDIITSATGGGCGGADPLWQRVLHRHNADITMDTTLYGITRAAGSRGHHIGHSWTSYFGPGPRARS